MTLLKTTLLRLSDALEDYPSEAFSFSELVKQLLNGKEHFIRIRERFQQQAVLLTSGPQGLKATNRPLSSGSLSDYLSRRALRAGYGPGVTIYAFRRKAATEWTRQVGLAQAKSLMTHEPNSLTLQKHYEQGFFDLDVTAIALREDPSKNHAEMDADASPALTRLLDFTKTEGAWLDEYVVKLSEQNKALQDAVRDGDAVKAAKLKRRIRRYASVALYEEQKVNQTARLTQAEFAKRKQELSRPMALFCLIKERAAALERAGKGIEELSGESEGRLTREDLRDIEEDEAAVQGNLVVDEDVGPDDQTVVTYSFAASMFMLTALEGYRVVGPDGNKEKCHLCLADVTLAEEVKVHRQSLPFL